MVPRGMFRDAYNSREMRPFATIWKNVVPLLCLVENNVKSSQRLLLTFNLHNTEEEISSCAAVAHLDFTRSILYWLHSDLDSFSATAETDDHCYQPRLTPVALLIFPQIDLQRALHQRSSGPNQNISVQCKQYCTVMAS